MFLIKLSYIPKPQIEKMPGCGPVRYKKLFIMAPSGGPLYGPENTLNGPEIARNSSK